ncbi:MAG: sugar-binding protein, partial [Bradymonadaceae bacterium]
GCQSQPETEKDEKVDKTTPEANLLNVQSEKDSDRKQSKWGGDIEHSVPEPPEKMSKTVDGKFGDWESAEFKEFGARDYVVEGTQFRNGRDDLSAEIAAQTDKGHLYLAIDVHDETVIDAKSVEPFADGAVLWLRDPGLSDLRESLPETVTDGDIKSEIGILFTPDGQFWKQLKEGKLYRKGVDAATVDTKSGYRIEIALEVGVMGQASKLPMPEVGFRVDVIDGDNRDRRGKQTRLTTVKPTEDDDPRYALIDFEGWRPYASLAGDPPREDALGRWKLAEKGWTFEPIEVAPERWRLLPNTDKLQAVLDGREKTPDLCPDAKSDGRLVDAYASKTGRDRIALMVCGNRAHNGECPPDAKTGLLWIHFKKESGSLQLHRALQVTDEPLNQCAHQPAPGEPFYSTFSMTPLEMIGPAVWAVGWHKTRETDAEQIRKTGIWMVNGNHDPLKVGSVQTSKKEAERRSRTISQSRVYLTKVDDNKGLDLCEIERIKEQRCRGFDRRCQTTDRGVETLAHIRRWKPEEGTFERLLVSKHENCQPPFKFAKRDAYMLFHRNERLGIIHSGNESSALDLKSVAE